MPFRANFFLTSFDFALFQTVVTNLPEKVFFSLAPLLMLQVRSQTNALVTSKKNKEMTYNILTDTDFFRDLESGNTASIKMDYGKFIEQTVIQC